MKRLLLILVLIVAGCTRPTVQSVGIAAVIPRDGPSVVAALNTAYDQNRPDCGTVNRPSFLCSGVLLRGTQASTGYHFWNPRVGTGWVSFSYLRRDATFNHLAVGLTHGFIFHPLLNAPAGTIALEVRCSFPIDGNSWIRQNGCGETSYYPGVSGKCQTRGIYTAAEWKAHFDRFPAGDDRERFIYSYVCSFDVRASQTNNADAFYQSLRAMHLVPTTLVHHYNELVFTSWAQQSDPTALPLQALFYVASSGLAGARYEQWDYYRSSGGQWIPIVAVHLPSVSGGTASFSYSAEDQQCVAEQQCTQPPL